MKHRKWIFLIFIATLVLPLLMGAETTQAQEPSENPVISENLPLPVPSNASQFSASSSSFTTTSLSLSPLKAVLLVGPIDGDTGAWTEQEKNNMELAASFLESQGVTVYRFYTPNNDWEAIKAAADGAHFLLYRGHGVYWPSGPDYGGFYLKNTFIRPEQISQDLRLAPNAIVMLYACYTAGSSGSDTGDIGLATAQYRVARYSEPFLELGIAGYYANWFGNAFEKFLTYLFEGRTLGGAYEAYFDFNAATVSRSYHPGYTESDMWLDKDDWRGYWEYNNAFVGQPDKTLEDLFPPLKPELGGIPEEITFVYSTSDATFMPANYNVKPQNLTTSDPIQWTVVEEANWFEISKSSGQTPEAFQVVPASIASRSVTPSYLEQTTGTITLQAFVDGKIETRTIQVNLSVVSEFTKVYLPLAINRF